MRRLLTISLLLAVSLCAFAQKGKITGKVVDSQTGEELIGATVMVLETGAGAVTDLYGRRIGVVGGRRPDCAML